jgi:hypothetical protein
LSVGRTVLAFDRLVLQSCVTHEQRVLQRIRNLKAGFAAKKVTNVNVLVLSAASYLFREPAEERYTMERGFSFLCIN